MSLKEKLAASKLAKSNSSADRPKLGALLKKAQEQKVELVQKPEVATVKKPFSGSLSLSLKAKTSAAKTEIKTSTPDEDPFAELASLDMGVVNSAKIVNTAENYKYKDQADKCDDDEMREFFEHMHVLVNAFDESAISKAVARCGMYIQEHEHLKQNILPADWGEIVKKMRDSCTQAAKASTATRKKRVVSNEKKTEAESMLADLGFPL